MELLHLLHLQYSNPILQVHYDIFYHVLLGYGFKTQTMALQAVLSHTEKATGLTGRFICISGTLYIRHT
jgi:hypothetical protein